MNPFKIGDVVKCTKNFLFLGFEFEGEQPIKDISKEQIRFANHRWFHYTHFELMKQGMLSKMHQQTQLLQDQDPSGLPQNTPGAKLDAGKPQASLLQDFGLALLQVAAVGTYGISKYSRKGWIEVKDGERRYADAALRHQLNMGLEALDPESQLLHAAHVAWNALASLELHLRAQKFAHPFHPISNGTQSNTVAPTPE